MSHDNFKCLNCGDSNLEKDEVIKLKCKHSYCWHCLTSYIESKLDCKIKCPSDDCDTYLNDSVIRQVLPDNKISDYEKISLSSIVELKEQCFKCLLPDCENIVFYTNKAIQFECSSCSLFNCISCAGTHPFLSCMEYQILKQSALENKDDKNHLESMEENEFMKATMKLQMNKQIQFIADKQLSDSWLLIPSGKAFTCTICLKIIPKETGIKLRNCSHEFCRSCLHGAINNSEVIPIPCLDSSCKFNIQDREIRGILSDQEYEIFNDKSLLLAQSKLQDIYHCKTPDCKYFGICDDAELGNFICPVCNASNCLKCNAIHGGRTCEDFQAYRNCSNTIDAKSIEFIEKEIKEGKCMKCPTCGCIIVKAGGCNWVKCPQCKLELCWILKIPRWGPKGNGDTSGGCKCGVNKKPCSPLCIWGCAPEN